VSVKTGGGQIDFGEVDGSVRAQTGGGGIRVMYVAGPMEVESTGGSICLTRVASSVRAATGDGTITAWINPRRTIPPALYILRVLPSFLSGSGTSSFICRVISPPTLKPSSNPAAKSGLKPIQHSLFVSATPVRAR